MKATFYILAMVFIMPASVYAQQTFSWKRHLTPQEQEHQRILNYALNQQAYRHGTANKPTDMQQRIVAQATSDGDSTVYKYTGSNGSSYNYNSINQDEDMFLYPMEYTAGPVIFANYDYNTTNLLADSILNFYDGELSDINFARYNTVGLIDSFGNSPASNLDNFDNCKVSYNASGKIDSLVEYLDFGGSLDIYTSIFIYDNDGKLVQNRQYYNGNADTLLLYYSANGLLDSIREGGTQGRFTYYPDNKLKTSITSNSDNGGVGIVYDSFGYTAGIDYTTFYSTLYIDGTDEAIDYGEQIVKIPDANGKIDTVKLNYYDGSEWYSDSYIKYHYNSYGNPDTLSAFDPDDNTLYGKVTFYYELYDDGTAVNNISDNKDFNIYPNPFTDNITIQYAGKNVKPDVWINLTDITGRSVYRNQIQLKQGQNIISVPAVPAGNYILLVRDAAGNIYSNKMVKH